MRNPFLFLFIFSAAFQLNAQNWKPIQPSVINYFCNGPLKAARVDSFTVSGADTILHLFRTPRGDSSVPYLDTNGGSWLGKTVIYKPNGLVLTPGLWGDTAVIYSLAALNDSWIFYKDTTAQYYKAKVISLDTATVLGVLDSIKIIKISAWNASGINTNDKNHGLTITLSKAHGYFKTFAVYTFPFHPSFRNQWHLGDDYVMDTRDIEQFPGIAITFTLTPFRNPTTFELYDYHTGDIYRHTVSCDGTNSSYSYDTIISVQLLTPDTLVYEWKRKTVYAAPGVINYESGSTKLADTIVPFLKIPFVPEETGLGYFYDYTPNDTTGCFSSASIGYFSNYIDPSGYVNTFVPCGSNFTFKIGLGLVIASQCDGFIPFCRSTTILTANRKNGIDCNLPTSINSPLKETDLRFYPNPAENFINIDYSREGTFTIYDVVGREVKREILLSGMKTRTVSLDGLPTGLYSYRFLDNDGNVANGKLIIQH